MPWLALAVVLALALLVCESMGWPFLITPLQHQFEKVTGRSLHLPAPGDAGRASVALHLWGGIRFQSPLLEIAAPPWSKAPYLMSATDLKVRLRYSDLWHAYRGEPVVVESLSASRLDAYLERLPDGRASWQLAPSTHASVLPQVQSMGVLAGQLHYQDAPLRLSLDAELSLTGDARAPDAKASSTPAPQRVLRGTASGRFREDAFHFTLVSTGALPWEMQGAQATPVAVKLAATVGRADLTFEGTAQDFLHLNGLDGLFRVHGPSLAAIGEPLGVTLPTTPAVQANGRVQRSGTHWAVALQRAQVGASQIHGDFVFETSTMPPRLTGTLQGALLQLADLAPAVGVTPPGKDKRVKVLPTRAFDLAALRSMDADVRIDMDQLDANTQLLEPLRPLRAHLLLTGGLLTLTEIDARTAQGHLGGTIGLDGQRNIARWVAALSWDGVQLQRWIHQQRAPGLPPYVSGQLQGHATLLGSGRSTAEILATLQGTIGATVENGTLSHLLVEAGGLDIAESLGVYLKGDNALVLDCAVADIAVAAGTLRPQLLVLDTVDSTVWVDGMLSLASEALDLRVVVAPKDFSVLALRSPLHVVGTLAQPDVQVEKGPLGLKLGAALLLGLINPLAAIMPLVDTGNAKEALASAARCRAHLHTKMDRLAVRKRTE